MKILRTTLLATGAALALGAGAVAPAAVAKAPKESVKTVKVAGGKVEIVKAKLAGRNRSYRLFRPAALPVGQAAPLVLVFHGLGQSAALIEKITRFDHLAAQQKFYVAYPDGTGTGGRRSWNAGACCSAALEEKVNDVAFASALIKRVDKGVNIDRKRVYSTGFSNGSVLTWKLGCELRDQIAAIAPVAAYLPDSGKCASVDRPLSVVITAGTGDTIIGWDGVLEGEPRKFFLKPTIRDVVAKVRAADGCPEPPTVSVGSQIISEVVSGCSKGSGVEMYAVRGLDHRWPGGLPNTVAQHGIDTTANNWRFLSAHTL